MSNFLAIATVTTALRLRVLDAVQADIDGATVTTVRPDDTSSSGVPELGVNIFLYQVVPNPARRNEDLPTRRGGGELATRPAAALDLHYLLSFYGSEGALEPQRLLGSTVARLHSQPVLTRAMIVEAKNDPTAPFLVDSNLNEAVETVKLTPQVLSLEELSRVWSVFFQTRYVLSTAYVAAVVLVEPDLRPREAPPTRDYMVRALPIRRPTIDRVVRQDDEALPIVAESPVFLLGSQLRGEVTTVEAGGLDAAVGAVSATRVAATLPAGLRAGAQPIRVRHAVQLGRPPQPHRGFASNVAAFVLHPEIRTSAAGHMITIDNLAGPPAARSAEVTIALRPQVGRMQRVALELHDAEGVAYTFPAEQRAADGDDVHFLVSGVAAGDYLFRVRVDGAESPFELDAGGEPAQPRRSL